MTLFDRTEQVVTRFAAGLALLGGMGLLAATAVTCASILLKLARRLLDMAFDPITVGEAVPWLHAILGEEELVTYGVGLALFAALPWVMINKGHIRIDLFETAFSAQFNKFLDVVSDICLAVLAYLILTRQWFLIFKKARGSKDPLLDVLLQGDLAQAADRVRSSQESQILGVPLWPTWVVAEICVFAFFIVACFCVLRSTRAFLQTRRSH